MRLGVLTGGGDAPGLNAAIRAVVLRATALGHEVFGIADGWAGLIARRAPPLIPKDVAHILHEGSTMLGTSRTDPRKDEAQRRACQEQLARLGLDALVAIGGNDNDLSETDYCIGFDTAVSVVTGTVDRLRTTASAHHRVMVVEAMGRDTGWVAAYGGLAGGADVILVPEIPATGADVVAAVRRLKERGDDDIIVVVAEAVEVAGLEAPTAVDRIWATRFGTSAVDLISAGRSGVLPVARGGGIDVATLTAAVGTIRRLDPEMVELVRRLAGTGAEA